MKRKTLDMVWYGKTYITTTVAIENSRRFGVRFAIAMMLLHCAEFVIPTRFVVTTESDQSWDDDDQLIEHLIDTIFEHLPGEKP